MSVTPSLQGDEDDDTPRDTVSCLIDVHLMLFPHYTVIETSQDKGTGSGDSYQGEDEKSI
jgi:hypothetical protein